MDGLVYRIDDLTDGTFYIGQTRSHERWENGYMGSGRMWSRHLKKHPDKAIYSNNPDAHEYKKTILIDGIQTREELDELELREILKYFVYEDGSYRKIDENCMNLSTFKQGDQLFCPECGAANNSHKKTCSHYKPSDVVCPECGGLRGNHYRNCSKFTKTLDDDNYIPVVQIKDNKIIKIYDSASDARDETNLNLAKIKDACYMKRQSSGGYFWRFLKDINDMENPLGEIKPTVENLPNEEWRDVVGYEGLYQVSNMGRVKTSRREIINSNNAHRIFEESLVYVSEDGNRLRVMFNKNKDGSRDRHSFTVHLLVAQAFLPNPTNATKVNHKNGDYKDNRLENLEWVNPENQKEWYSKERRKTAAHKRRVAQIDIDTGKVIKIYDSLADASRATGSRDICISRCCRGLNETSRGYRWKYEEDLDNANELPVT